MNPSSVIPLSASVLPNFASTLTHDLWLKLLFAFITGCIGSCAYISVVYFGFVGKDDTERLLILEPFLKDKSNIHGGFKCLKFVWYCSIGGFIAVIFQYPEGTFVPIQNFLFGVTWPSMISQHISGRMKVPNQEELEKFRQKLQSVSEPTLTSEQQNDIKQQLKSVKKLLKSM